MGGEVNRGGIGGGEYIGVRVGGSAEVGVGVGVQKKFKWNIINFFF